MSMQATRFSIVTTLPRTLIIARHLLHQYGFHQHCAALHAIDLPVLALEDGSGLARWRKVLYAASVPERGWLRGDCALAAADRRRWRRN